MELLEHYKNIFQYVKVPIKVIAKDENNEFLEREFDFKDVVADLDKTATIRNLTEYVEHKSFNERVNVELLTTILNKIIIPFSMVIVDQDFSEVLNSSVCGTIQIVSEGTTNLYLATRTTQEKKLPELVDAETKKYLLDTLLKNNNSSIHYGFHNGSLRRYITGIDEYRAICTKLVPFGIDGEWFNRVGCIISPVTIKQWESNKHLEKSAFVDLICGSDEFLNLVEHVYVHQIEDGKYTKQEIEDKYREFIEEMYQICKN